MGKQVGSWKPSSKKDEKTGLVEKDTYEYLLTRRQELKNMRSSFESDWDEEEELYSSEESTTGDTDVSINFQTAYTFVQTSHAERMDNLPQIVFEPVESNDIVTCQLQQAVFDHMWHKSKSDLEYQKVDLAMGINGTAFMQTTFDRRSRKVYDPEGVDKETGEINKWKEREIIVNDDVRNEYVDIRDIFPNTDTDNPTMDNINDIMRRKTVSWENWEAYYKNNPIFKNTEYVTTTETVDKNPNKEEAKKGNIPKKEVILWYYWNEAKDLYAIMAGDILILETRMDVNKRLPFAKYVNHLEPNSFYGRSEVRLLKKMAEFKNEFVNMMLAQSRYTVYTPMLVPDTIDFTDYPDKNPTWSPGAVWPVSDPGAVQFAKVPPLASDAYNIVNQLNNEMIYSTAINPQAVMSQPGNESAFEKSIQRNSQQIRIRVAQNYNARDGLQRTAELAWGLIQFYYSKERAKTITGDVTDEGTTMVALKNKKIVRKDGKIMKIIDSDGAYDIFEATPEIIRNPVNVRVKQSPSMVNNKELQAAKLNEALQNAAPYASIPEIAQRVPYADILIEIFKNLGIRPDLRTKEQEEKDPYKENDDLINGVKVRIEPGEDHEYHLSVHSELKEYIEKNLKDAMDMYQLTPEDEDRESNLVLAQIIKDRYERHLKDTIRAKLEEEQPLMPLQGMSPQQGMGQLKVPVRKTPQQGEGQMQGQSLTMNNV